MHSQMNWLSLPLSVVSANFHRFERTELGAVAPVLELEQKEKYTYTHDLPMMRHEYMKYNVR